MWIQISPKIGSISAIFTAGDFGYSYNRIHFATLNSSPNTPPFETNQTRLDPIIWLALSKLVCGNLIEFLKHVFMQCQEHMITNQFITSLLACSLHGA